MMKTEYIEKDGCLQRDGVEHKEYAEACSTEVREVVERDGADLLEKVLDGDNLNKAYKRVKANKGASEADGMTVDEALPWLKEHRDSTPPLSLENSTLRTGCGLYLPFLMLSSSSCPNGRRFAMDTPVKAIGLLPVVEYSHIP